MCALSEDEMGAGLTSFPHADDVVRYAAVGDVVSVHFVMRDEDGQGFDEAVRGMAVGQTTVLEVSDAGVKLDANNMLAGKTFTIELELVSIDAAASPLDA
ncbi:hypothetical protein GPECTOR_2g1299 [Gonium pectorale]|uniref:peptidylprolyl isomerase n=1 Tax=Gonium pectorale TaxID=33097 RepID=A0A150H0V0_GONPE|nr:hypothetical protein GPECTOR_2g1299 [Gonium pectorale]|eukprot:KXZ55749.1 hypothetical protein GPECTOR_2g1299 [Gonium pectorale]